MVFLTFSPLYILILLANLTPRKEHWRLLTLILLGTANVLLLGVGVLATAAGALANVSPAAFPPGMGNPLALGITLIITGIAGLLVMPERVRAALYPALRWNMDPASLIHLTAVNLAFWAIGGNLAVMLWLRSMSMEMLTESFAGAETGLLTMWEQAAAFVLIALLGVGIGLRRGWRETFARLGVGGLSPKQILLLPLLVVALLLLQMAISWLWLTFDPDSMDRIGELTEMLLGDQVMTLAGAFTIGLSAGIGEELLMRGAVQPRFGILFTSVIFTILHAQYELSFATLLVFLLSIVLGLVRRYMNTTACILIHAGYNSSLVLISLYAEQLAQ